MGSIGFDLNTKVLRDVSGDLFMSVCDLLIEED